MLSNIILSKFLFGEGLISLQGMQLVYRSQTNRAKGKWVGIFQKWLFIFKVLMMNVRLTLKGNIHEEIIITRWYSWKRSWLNFFLTFFYGIYQLLWDFFCYSLPQWHCALSRDKCQALEQYLLRNIKTSFRYFQVPSAVKQFIDGRIT